MTTTKKNTVLYTGSTSDLKGRIHQHKTKEFPNSFTAKYNVDKLVYYEYYHFIEEAIEREKQIKSWKRVKKIKLIVDFNSEWKDLYDVVDNWD